MQLWISKSLPSGPKTFPTASQTHLKTRSDYPVSLSILLHHLNWMFVPCYGNQDGTFFCPSLLCPLRMEQLPHTCTACMDPDHYFLSLAKNYSTSSWKRHLLPSQPPVFRFYQIYWMWQVMLRRVSHISLAPHRVPVGVFTQPSLGHACKPVDSLATHVNPG